MITSVKPWKTKSELQDIVRDTPNLVSVTGTLFDKELKTSFFSDTVDRIPYKHYVIVKWSNDYYKFGVAIDGRITVE
jgi:hypothetical protein